MSPTETMNTPAPDQIREALDLIRLEISRYPEGSDERAERQAVLDTLESALAQPASEASPPPVEDAAVDEALAVIKHAALEATRMEVRHAMDEARHTLRADRAAKDAEIERFCDADTAMQEDLERVQQQQRDVLQREKDAVEYERDALKAQLAAEADCFRVVADEWESRPTRGHMVPVEWMRKRAEADRREGKND